MNKILDMIMNYVYKDEEADEEQCEVVRYGLEIILLKSIFTLAILVIGVIMHSFWECLIFTVLFSGIRSYAGGYHADTRIQCFIQSMATFSVVLCVLKICNVNDLIIIPLVILFMLSAAAIIKLAPIDTENKRLDDEEKAVFKRKSRLSLFSETIIAITAYCIGLESISYAVMLAVIVTALLLAAEVIKNRKRRINE